MELSPVPGSISDEEFKLNICKALFLNRYEVKPDNLPACHPLKKKETVIIRLKFRKHKHKVPIDSKILHNKSEDLHQLKFSGKLFISENMCHESHQLAYECC